MHRSICGLLGKAVHFLEINTSAPQKGTEQLENLCQRNLKGLLSTLSLSPSPFSLTPPKAIQYRPLHKSCIPALDNSFTHVLSIYFTSTWIVLIWLFLLPLMKKKMLRQAVVDVNLTGGSHRLLRKRHDTQAKFKHRLGAWKTPQQQLTLKATNCLFWEEPNLESVNQFQMECNTKNTLLCKNQPVISLYFACNDPNSLAILNFFLSALEQQFSGFLKGFQSGFLAGFHSFLVQYLHLIIFSLMFFVCWNTNLCILQG